jgi:hypothetical protein
LLIAALWETYCEDVLLETANELIGATDDPHSLPVAIRRAVAKDLKDAPHDLSPWLLAGAGWREVVEARAKRLCRETVFHSPKAGNVDELFRRTLGIQNITTSWKSSRATDPRSALDEHVVRRGELAHRAANTTIAKRQVSDFYQLAKDSTESMDRRLGAFLLDAVGADPFAVPDTEALATSWPSGSGMTDSRTRPVSYTAARCRRAALWSRAWTQRSAFRSS